MSLVRVANQLRIYWALGPCGGGGSSLLATFNSKNTHKLGEETPTYLLVNTDHQGQRVSNLDVLGHKSLRGISIEDAHAGGGHGGGGGEGRGAEPAGEEGQWAGTTSYGVICTG